MQFKLWALRTRVSCLSTFGGAICELELDIVGMACYQIIRAQTSMAILRSSSIYPFKIPNSGLCDGSCCDQKVCVVLRVGFDTHKHTLFLRVAGCRLQRWAVVATLLCGQWWVLKVGSEWVEALEWDNRFYVVIYCISISMYCIYCIYQLIQLIQLILARWRVQSIVRNHLPLGLKCMTLLT